MLALQTIESFENSSQNVTLISARLQSLLAFRGKAANPLIPRLAGRRDQAVRARIHSQAAYLLCPSPGPQKTCHLRSGLKSLRPVWSRYHWPWPGS